MLTTGLERLHLWESPKQSWINSLWTWVKVKRVRMHANIVFIRAAKVFQSNHGIKTNIELSSSQKEEEKRNPTSNTDKPPPSWVVQRESCLIYILLQEAGVATTAEGWKEKRKKHSRGAKNEPLLLIKQFAKYEKQMYPSLTVFWYRSSMQAASNKHINPSAQSHLREKFDLICLLSSDSIADNCARRPRGTDPLAV